MNITLSADKKLVETARNYARKHNTSLNNLVRDYLQKIVNESDTQASADEFEHNALTFAGRSKADFKFNREEIYDRDK